MSTNPNNIFVAGVTRVFLADVGTTAPTTLDPSTYDAGLKEVGLFTDDSLSFKTNPSFQAVNSAQSPYPTRRIENGAEASVSVDLQEWKGDNLISVYGGGTITETTTGSGIWKFTPPVIGGRGEKMCVMHLKDAAREAVLIVPRCMQMEGVDHALGRGKESTLPLRLDILGSGSGDPFYWLFNDTNAFAPAAPTASAISPATGLAAGGYPALITGTNLRGVSAVTFGGVAATGVDAISETQLYVIVPAHAAGAVNVVITDNGGVLTKTNFFTYS